MSASDVLRLRTPPVPAETSRADGTWACAEMPVELPVYYTAASVRQEGLPPSATRPRSYRRSVVPGVFAHPTRTVLSAVPVWADEEWMHVRNQTAALQTRRPDAVLSHLSAALFYGWPLPAAAADARIDVTPRRSNSGLPGFHVHRARETEALRLYGITVASPVQTLRQVAACLDEAALVEVVDALCGPWRSAAHTTPAELARRLADRPRFSGSRRLLRAVALGRANVGSPQETRVRRTIADAGFPEPVVAYPVQTEQRVYHPDLSYPSLKIALEYEGSHHLTDAEQWDRDIARERAFRESGWEYIRITKRTGNAEMLRLLTRAFARRGIVLDREA